MQINLQGCQPGHVKARMLQYQKDDVDILMAEFDKRLPQHDAINHLARVFRFDLCPFKQDLIFKPLWAEKLREVYESITWLCENRYLSLSAHFATVEWGKLARFLQGNWRRFWDKDEVPAGAAHAVFFRQADLGPCRRRHPRRPHAARAATDYKKIKVKAHCAHFLILPCQTGPYATGPMSATPIP